MITTVVGSFGIDLKEPETLGEKIRSSIGLYDPYKIAIEEAVKLQLDCGIDIIGDGQPRGDMVGSFVKHIPGFSYEMNSSVIVSKIRAPQVDIMIKDLKFALNVLKREIKDRNMSEDEASKKGVKLMLTGPSTIVHSSRVESFYKERNPAIIDCAYALRREVESAEKAGAKYVQIDEPFLSTGMVDLKVAKEAIGILTDGIEMPMGMQTVISEGSSNISGGQRQRIMIARALAAKPAILIFDEATSALDNRTQAIVTKSLDKLNTTRLVIAHRLSTIRNCDRILVMDKGSIVESGTYEELLAQNGIFAQLVKRQVA